MDISGEERDKKNRRCVERIEKNNGWRYERKD